ncbi:MAG: hypothetical protein ACRDRY_21235 [Pseudonocardiaceae bacterium]
MLADPLLALAAEVLDDLERVRVANENRLRQLTRTDEDSDGEERGFGLPMGHPDVARLAALVKGLADAEHQAELNLNRQMRQHPLWPWVRSVRGVGQKQAARLLAAIGDPYWNDLYGRPRMVSELMSYCGYGDPERQVLRRGQKVNWSPAAKMRTHLIAKSIVKQLVKPCHSIKGEGGLVAYTVHVEGECSCSPYRPLYDQEKARYAGSTHPVECHRCTPKNAPPAPVGSPRKGAHIEAIALRAVSKAILKDLWREAKRHHELPGGQRSFDTHHVDAAGDTSPPEPGDPA